MFLFAIINIIWEIWWPIQESTGRFDLYQGVPDNPGELA